jgi:hypothetical protein
MFFPSLFPIVTLVILTTTSAVDLNATHPWLVLVNAKVLDRTPIDSNL